MLPHLQVQSRVENTRSTLQREVNVFRDSIGNIANRARHPLDIPDGRLAAEPFGILGNTLNNVASHIRNAAYINRRVVGR